MLLKKVSHANQGIYLIFFYFFFIKNNNIVKYC